MTENTNTPNRDELLGLLSKLQGLLIDYHPGLATWHAAYEERVTDLLKFFGLKPKDCMDCVANDRDWNVLAKEMGCENTREEMVKWVRNAKAHAPATPATEEYSLEDFRNDYPELSQLWQKAPIPLGLDNSNRQWIRFAEFVRKSAVAEAAPTTPEWISVEDGYPPRHQDVLCLNRDGDVFTGRICAGMHKPFFTYPRGFGNPSNTCPDWIDVTHWRPMLPSPAGQGRKP